MGRYEPSGAADQRMRDNGVVDHVSRAAPKRGPRGPRRLAVGVMLAAFAISLSGCIVAPGGPGWCYYHPYRCR